MEAFYNNGMFSNGLSAIQTDELHTYEEGIQVLPQVMLVDYANPKHVERIMETAKALERVAGVNSAGHRHIRSSYYSGEKLSEESVWEWSKPYSYLVLHPAMSLVEYNGHPAAKKLMLELADGVLAHRKQDGRGNWIIDTTINFRTDEGQPGGLGVIAHLLWGAYRWTGDKKYLQPLLDMNAGAVGTINANAIDLLSVRGTWGKQIAASVTPQSGGDLQRHIAWQITGNKQYLEELYADQIKAASIREYINTLGHLWSDRVSVNHNELQRARLGGLAITRNALYPGHAASWKFDAPATGESVAILIPDATTTWMKIIAYNLETAPVNAVMTAWDIEPGLWDVTQGIDSDGDDTADRGAISWSAELERAGDLELTFAPRAVTIIQLKLKKKGTPYWSRPDLGIGKDDVTVEGNTIRVKVHNIGAVDAPAATVTLRDQMGKALVSMPVPEIKAPLDYTPRIAEVTLQAPPGTDLKGFSVTVDSGEKVKEITRKNNSVRL